MGMKLCDSDFYFMCVVWDEAPVRSGELVKGLDGKSQQHIPRLRSFRRRGF